MTIKKLPFILMITAIVLFQVSFVHAADIASKAYDPIRISYEREEKITELEAEVKRLNAELTRIQSMAQGKIRALEDEVKYLRQALENVRTQVGFTEPAPSQTGTHGYVE